MAVEAKDVILYAKLGLIFCIRNSYRFARNHPFVSGFAFFLLLLYRCFPSLFAFLVSSSPVFICTALLLGTLLSYGEPNIPEIEEEDKTPKVSSFKTESAADELVVSEANNFTVETHVERRREITEMAVEATTLLEEIVSADKVESYLSATIHHDELEKKDNDFVASSSLIKEDSKVGVVSEHLYQRSSGDLPDTKPSQVATTEGADVSHVPPEVENQFEYLEVEINQPALDNQFDSSLGSPWQPIGRHDVSLDSESDQAESSSPDASMADILPMLDELHPLLGSEPPHSAHKSVDNSDTASHSSCEDHEADESSADEEDTKPGKKEDENRDVEKDDGAEAVLKWTADDQKNLMDLGISELERNQRLENLIAKRRVRKKFETKRNLIDTDINEVDPIMEQLRGLHIEIRPISATRRNPFDLPYESEENMDLRPIPGSAPSMLQPRRNPFDFLDEPEFETGVQDGQKTSPWELETLTKREMFFRRHESFNVGSSSSNDINQERRRSQFRPYFVAERTDSDAAGSAIFQRQWSGNSDSKVSSVPESDSLSSVLDQEDSNKCMEPENHHQENELLSPTDHMDGRVELAHQSSEEVDSIDADQEPNEINIGDESRMGFNPPAVTELSHMVVNAFGAVEEEIRLGEEPSSPVSEAGQVEEIEDKFDHSSSSSLSEDNDRSLTVDGEKATLHQRLDASEDSSSSVHPAVSDSNIPSNMELHFEDGQRADPIYDSYPLPTEKSLSNLTTLDEDLLFAGEEGSYSRSLSSDLQVEISDVGSPSRLAEVNVPSDDGEPVFYHGNTGESLSSGIGGVSVASPSSDLVDKNKSRSREMSVIQEHDVLGMGPPAAGADFIVFSLDTDAREDFLLEAGASHESKVTDLTSSSAPYLDKSLLDSDLIPASSGMEHESLSNPSERAALEEFQLSVLGLPPIPEEILQETKLEEPNPTNLADVQQKHNVGHTESVAHLLKNDVSIPSPGAPCAEGSFTGLNAGDRSEDMIHPKLDMIDKFQNVEEGGLTKSSFDSEEESGEVHDNVKDFKELGESMLSELDVVSDFHVEKMKSDEGLSEMRLLIDSSNANGVISLVSTEMQSTHPQLEASEDRCLVDERDLIIEQPKVVKSEFDPEQTVYNSNLCVLDTCSLMEVDSAFCESMLPDTSESAVDKLQESMDTGPELLVIEAKSVDDINSAFKQLSHADPVTLAHHEARPSEISTHTELLETRSKLEVDEAKSHEETHLAIKQLSSVAETSNKPVESRDEPSEFEAVQKALDSEVIKNADVKSSDSGLLVLEAKSIEDINSAFKKLHGDGADASLYLEAGPSETLQGRIHEEQDSVLQVLEARSLEDIQLALKQHSDATSEGSLKVMEIKDAFAEVEANARQLEPEVLGVKSIEETEVAGSSKKNRKKKSSKSSSSSSSSSSDSE